MAKTKKSELTLEELQAKKAKTQRGWVRFCAILLAVLLTVGIYGVASRGEPNTVKLQPNVVRVNTQTVTKGDSTPTPDSDSSDTDTTPAPTPSTDESGGILDTIMGLLGGLDFSKITGMLDINGLGVKVASGIDKAKDSLLTLVDKIEGSLTKKPVITHDAVEADFAEDVELGDAVTREGIVALLNRATEQAVESGSYRINRQSAYKGDGVSIGEQTDTLNKVLGQADLSLNDLVAQFNGVGNAGGVVVDGKLPVVDKENPTDAAYGTLSENYLLKATALKAEDLAEPEANPLTGEYSFILKNVAHPNRQADCGLTRLTDDYLVQNEIAPLVAGLAITNNEAFSLLKLTDLEMMYSDIKVSFKVNPLTGSLVSLKYSYETYGKFTVRTNSVQVIGAATTTTEMTYSDFPVAIG